MPPLLASRGAIVNIGSVAGLLGVKKRFAHCATKGAVIAMARQLAVDPGENTTAMKKKKSALS